jgi:hypothetical protein
MSFTPDSASSYEIYAKARSIVKANLRFLMDKLFKAHSSHLLDMKLMKIDYNKMYSPPINDINTYVGFIEDYYHDLRHKFIYGVEI